MNLPQKVSLVSAYTFYMYEAMDIACNDYKDDTNVGKLVKTGASNAIYFMLLYHCHQNKVLDVIRSAACKNPAQTPVTISQLKNYSLTHVWPTNAVRCIGDIMSGKINWFKGPVCGRENCKTKWYYEEAGRTVCRRGHEQEVVIP